MSIYIIDYTCSYCPKVATFEGTRCDDGTMDADFYCDLHTKRAASTLVRIKLGV
jgi:hypothetical protein